MKKVLLGMTISMVLTLGLIVTLGVVLLGNNIVVERVEQTHNRTIIEDGKVASCRDWTEVLGYNVSINLQDDTYIGR